MFITYTDEDVNELLQQQKSLKIIIHFNYAVIWDFLRMSALCELL